MEGLPDIPTLLSALEQTFSKLIEHDNYSKITKHELATNQEIMLDALIDFAKYLVASTYKVDLLDKAVARAITLKEDEPEDEPEEEVTEVRVDYDIFS